MQAGFEQDEHQHEAVGESHRLEHAEFLGALAHRLAMVLPATSRMVKNTAPTTAMTMVPMSPICWAKPAANAPSASVLVS